MLKQYKLTGFINLFDLTPDFIYPIFRRAGKYFFQHSTDGMIQEFVEVKKDVLAKIQPVEKLQSIVVHEKSGLIYAYQIDEKSIVYGNTVYMESYLKEKALFSEAYHFDRILKEEIDDFLDEAENEKKRSISNESIGDTTFIKSNAHHGILSSLLEKPLWKRYIPAAAISLSVCLCILVLNKITNPTILPTPPMPTSSMNPVQINWSGINTESVQFANRDYGMLFQLSLSEEQFNSLADMRFEVFQKKDEAYALVSDTHVEIDREANFTLSAEHDNQALYIVDSDGNALSSALPYSVEQDGSYRIEAKLLSHGDDSGISSRVQALLVCKKSSKNNEIYIQSAKKWNEQLQQYDFQPIVSISDYDTLEIVQQFRVPQTHTNGTLLSWKEWPVVKEKNYTCSLKEGQKLVLLTHQLALSDLYASFAIRDYQNQNLLSSLLQMEEVSEKKNILIQYGNRNYALLDSPSCTVIDNKVAKLTILTMKVKNITDHEVIIKAENVVVNQKSTQLSSIVNGNGPNWGLLNSEVQTLTLSIPDDIINSEDINEIEFSLVVQYMDNESVREIPVKIFIHEVV